MKSAMVSRLAAPLVASAAMALVPTLAYADGTIRNPGDHPDYRFDIEPHGVLGYGYWDPNAYGFFGFGGGVRISMPICKNCFVPRINNNVAISFGADFIFYPLGDAARVFGFTPSYLALPVALQWNFFVHKKWSVAGEPGFTPLFGVFYNYGNCAGGCNNWGIYPTLSAVGRYHFSDKIALTMRIGTPPEFFNIGVSFWL